MISFLIKPILEHFIDSNLKRNSYYIKCIRNKKVESREILLKHTMVLILLVMLMRYLNTLLKIH